MVELINYELPDKDYDDIVAALQVLETKLSPLLSVIPQADKNKQYLAAGSKGYAQDSINEAKANPGALALDMNVSLLEKNWILLNKIEPIASKATPLLAGIINARQATGQAVVYECNRVKEMFEIAAKRNNKYKPAFNKLSKHYKKSKKNNPSPSEMTSDEQEN